MNSVTKKSGKSKADSSAPHEEPASERVMRSAERVEPAPSDNASAPSGVRTVIERECIDGIPTLGLSPDRLDENGETMAGRKARFDTERELMACEIPGSLGSRIRQLLGQGLWVDADAPAADNGRSMSGSLERAISRVAAIQLRAVAVALATPVSVESGLDSEIELSNDDAALALAGIATTLEVGFLLADDLRMARTEVQQRTQREAADGGAS